MVIRDAVNDDEIKSLLDYYQSISDDQKINVARDNRLYEEEPVSEQLDSLIRPILSKFVDYDFTYAPSALFQQGTDFNSHLHVDSEPTDMSKWGHVIIIPLKILYPGASTIVFANRITVPSSIMKFCRGHAEFAGPIADIDGKPIWFDDIRNLLPLVESHAKDATFHLGAHTFKNDARLQFRVKNRILRGAHYKDTSANYQLLSNLDLDHEIDPKIYEDHLAHIHPNDLRGLVVEQVIDWRIGDVIKFERSAIHTGGTYGRGKIGFTAFLNKK